MLSHLPALDHEVMVPSTFPLGHLRVRRNVSPGQLRHAAVGTCAGAREITLGK
jgi:hypothetical protein